MNETTVNNNYFCTTFLLSKLLHVSVYLKTTTRHGLVYIYIIIIGIQPLGRSGQRPELSQATGMALVRCILGMFS